MTNLLQNLSAMVNGFLPLSIISKETVREILLAVMTNELENGSRLTLAIPLTEKLTYYESKLLHKNESDFNPHYLRYTKQSQYRCHCRMVMQIYGNWRSNILLPERDSSGIKK